MALRFRRSDELEKAAHCLGTVGSCWGDDLARFNQRHAKWADNIGVHYPADIWCDKTSGGLLFGNRNRFCGSVSGRQNVYSLLSVSGYPKALMSKVDSQS